MNCSTGTIFLTVPETLACTGAPTYPPGTAISVPTSTWSPGLTTQLAGRPMLMLRGMVTMAGGGILTGGISAVFFLCGICTPLRSFNDILSTSFQCSDN